VILLTRLRGAPFALNPDLIERADRTPDTVITLVDGTKYVVSESLAELIDLVVEFRAAVLDATQHPTEAEAEPGAKPWAEPGAKPWAEPGAKPWAEPGTGHQPAAGPPPVPASLQPAGPAVVPLHRPDQ